MEVRAEVIRALIQDDNASYMTSLFKADCAGVGTMLAAPMWVRLFVEQ